MKHLSWLVRWLSMAASGGCVALLLAGCAPATAPAARTQLREYADGTEYYIPTKSGVIPRGEAATIGVTRYFHIDATRVCYAFELPGTWEAGRESAVARRLDGKGLVGVMLFSLDELGGRSMEDAIRTAAERSDELYAQERAGIPSILTPYPGVPTAWRWSVPVEVKVSDRPGAVGRIPPRWYLPIGRTWLAQFSIAVPPDVDADTFVTGILTSLTANRERRCYESQLRRLGVIR